jgi:hypothetical protein
MWFYWSTLTINNSIIISPLLEYNQAAQYGLIWWIFIASIKDRPRKAFNYISVFSNTFGNLANHFWVRSKPYGGPIKFAGFVQPSVRTKQLQSPWMDLHEIWYWGVLIKFVDTFWFLSKSAKETRTLYVTTHMSFCECLEPNSISTSSIYLNEKHFKY